MDILGDKVFWWFLVKLMFYLCVVVYCVDIEDLCDVWRWMDFFYYYLLMGQEVDGMVCLCFVLFLDVFQLKCFKENDFNCGGFDMVFYDSDYVKIWWDYVVLDSIILWGSVFCVMRVMECRIDWLQEFYY